MADIGLKIERLARGESTEKQSITETVEHKGKITVAQDDAAEWDLSDLTFEELEDLDNLLEKINVKEKDDNVYCSVERTGRQQ